VLACGPGASTRTVCDICDGTLSLVKYPWRGKVIDLCFNCEQTYDMEPKFRVWADKVIARNLGLAL
jgi:hypothetical protein